MKVTPPSAARSRTDLDAGSSICSPKVIVPRQRRETFRPVRPRRVCCMATPPGLVHSAVVGLHLEGFEPMVDVGVADEEIETDSGTARGEDLVGGGDDLDAVDEPLEHVAGHGPLGAIAILDAEVRADQLLQRGE